MPVRLAPSLSTIAAAALSARVMAQAAAAAGRRVLALDAFGDLDTRRAALAWLPIGAEGSARIDPGRCLAALRDARGRGATAWVAGAGFEACPEVLAEGATLLPLLGTAPRQQAATRDPAGFFALLDAHGIAHPAVRFRAPDDPAGWIEKDARASGGWHIRAAVAGGARGPTAPTARTGLREPTGPTAVPIGTDASEVPPGRYFQRLQQGEPMSACFVADGHRAALLGCNRLRMRAFGERPFVYAGAIGPVELPAAAAAALDAALAVLVVHYEVRGLASLDFMLDGDRLQVLELNARPSATMALYEAQDPGSTFAAHLAACIEGRLPAPFARCQAGGRRRAAALGNAASAAAAIEPQHPAGEGPVEGTEIVYATGPLRLALAAAGRLAAFPGVQDLPAPGAVFAAADPICSLSVRGHHAAEVEHRLTTQRLALLHALETS